MKEERKCKTCEYYKVTEEYWHDHYLISPHDVCIFSSPYRPKDIDVEGCCENYKRKREDGEK